MSRKLIALGYCLLLCGTASQADANAGTTVSPQIIVQSVSGVMPDSTGNVPFGCPLSPFNARRQKRSGS